MDESVLDYPINELIRLYPELVPCFLSNKMDCIGCDFDRFHSMRFALELYEVSLDQFLSNSIDMKPTQVSDVRRGER
jgi:hypothetical protein